MRVGKDLSDIKKLENGVPQGAVLSPILFNILIDIVATIPRKHPHIEIGQFADDTALWVKPESCYTLGTKSSDHLAKLLEPIIEELINLLESNGFKINVKKTQAIFFHRPANSQVKLRVHNTTIVSTPNISYLGMEIDRSFVGRRNQVQLCSSSLAGSIYFALG